MDKILDIICILIIVCCILKYVQIKRTCNKYNKINNKLSLSGCEVAQKLLGNNKLDDIYVVQTNNPLYEKYDSNRKVIRLSKKVFDDISISAMVKASREVGYALLDKKHSKIYKIKDSLYMPINMLNYICYIVIVASCFLKDFKFLKIGLLSLLLIVIYHLLFYKFDRDNLKNISSQLKKYDMIDDEDEIKDLLNELSFCYVLYPIHLLTILYILIKQKIND